MIIWGGIQWWFLKRKSVVFTSASEKTL